MKKERIVKRERNGRKSPKITEVNLKLELYPSTRDYTAEGYYILSNPYDHEIREIHIQKIIEDHQRNS